MNFKTVFGIPSQASGEAPGRVNLMGEHTDYNQGFVLPKILPQTTRVELAIDGDLDKSVHVFSAHYQEEFKLDLDSQNQGQWTDYILSCLRQLKSRQIEIPSLKILIQSNIPIGAGISSSAALEVAILKGINHLLQLHLTGLEIAQLAQKAESLGVGMPCGMMDQMVCTLGQPDNAFFLDTQDLSFRPIPLPPDHGFAVVHSGKSHALVTSGYQQRREECEAAAKMLQVNSLRELTDLQKLAPLPSLLRQRAAHVVTENQRVLESVKALENLSLTDLGQLMNASHLSQKEQFEVTVPETDRLWEKANLHGALGARQTGGGFGGSIVALVPKTKFNTWWEAVAQDCPEARLISKGYRDEEDVKGLPSTKDSPPG